MTRDWYREVDFSRNPFKMTTKTFGAEDVLEEIFYAIVSGNIVVLEGEDGMGKTKVLNEARKKFRNKAQVIYLHSAKVGNGLNIEEELKKKAGWLRRLFDIKPKNMVLLLDDVESLTPRNSERIKYYYDQNYLRSVVFATKDFGNIALSPSLMHRISRIIKVKPLSDYEAVQLVRNKIGKRLLSDRIIKIIYNLSARNTKHFLKNCEKVCQAAVYNQPITEESVGRLLSK